MRNLKRALSLVLAALMLIGMMVVGAGAAGVDDFTDRDEIVNKDAVSMLTILGVINGKEDGSYYAPKDNVTRAEMAKMIATILNQGADVNDLYANLDTGLTDINNSWAKGYINYCYSLGIIAGRGNGIFDPTAPVTGNEAAKMLLVAIGYDPEIEGLTGATWAIKTTSLASTLGIFDDLTAATSENLNRDNAALLIYNALDVEMVQKYEDGYAVIFNDHRTLLSNKYGVYKVEGVVTANEWAELNQTNSDATAKTGKTTLDQVKVYASTTSNTTVAEYVEEKEPVTFNVSTSVDLLGKAVTMYIKKTTVLANSTVLGVTVNDKMNVIEGTVANTTAVTDLLKGTGLSVDNDTEYYVNYGYETKVNATALINNYALNKSGSKFNMNGVEVSLIDNNNDGDVEYVLYTRETLSNVVRTSDKDETVTINAPLVDGKGLLRTVNNKSTETVVLDNADVVTDLQLAADDLILYVQYGGRTYITAPTIVTGTMTRVDRDQAKELYVTLDDGETYKMSYIREVESQVDADISRFDIELVDKTNGAQFKTKYDFILDSNGYIVAFRPAEEVVDNYGLVLESAWTQNALDKAGQVKILTVDNIETTYAIDWSNSAKNAFWNDTNNNGVYDSGEKSTAVTALENYLGTRDVNTNGLEGNSLHAAAGTVIKYSVNEDNVLTIDAVLRLNGLDTVNNDGTLAVKSNADADQITVSTGEPAYIAGNTNAYNNGVVSVDASNLQYTLTSAYKNGDGYLNVITSAANDKGQTFAIDKNTIAFYYVSSSEYGVATGWDNMGNVNKDVKAQVYPVISKTGNTYTASSLADVVLFNAKLDNDTANWLLVLNANAINSDSLELNVVFEDGTTKAIIVNKADYSYFNDDDSYMKAYKYSVDGNDKYTISTSSAVSAVPASLLQNGTLDANAYGYLTLTGTSNVWDVTGVDNAGDTVNTGKFEYANAKNAVIIRTNNNKTVKTAWVWDMDADNNYASTCNFDWNLTNYETIWATNTIYDYMQMADAFKAGKNVKLVGNVDLTVATAYPISIPAGLTVQIEGNLTTGGNGVVTGDGDLRVYGTYNAGANINVPTQALNLVTVDNIAFNADTHVYNNIQLGDNDAILATDASTIASGVHVCAKTGTVTVYDTLYVNGHIEGHNFDVWANMFINSNQTMLVFNNLTIHYPATVYVGNTAAGSLIMAGTGTISGDGNLVVGSAAGVAGTVTLSTGSDIALTGDLTLNSKGVIQQNYATKKVLSADEIYLNGTINVPGNVEALTKLTSGSDAKGTIGGVFKEAGTVVTVPGVTSGTDTGATPGTPVDPTKTNITSVAVTATAPALNGTLAAPTAVVTPTNGATVTYQWSKDGANVANGTTVTAGTYKLTITVAPADGYQVTANTAVTVNGTAATGSNGTYTFTFPAVTDEGGSETPVTPGDLPKVAWTDSNKTALTELAWYDADTTATKPSQATVASKLKTDLQLTSDPTVIVNDNGTASVSIDGKSYTVTLTRYYAVSVDGSLLGYAKTGSMTVNGKGLEKDDTFLPAATIQAASTSVYKVTAAAGSTIVFDKAFNADVNLKPAVQIKLSSVTALILDKPDSAANKYSAFSDDNYAQVGAEMVIVGGTNNGKYTQLTINGVTTGTPGLAAADNVEYSYTVKAEDVATTAATGANVGKITFAEVAGYLVNVWNGTGFTTLGVDALANGTPMNVKSDLFNLDKANLIVLTYDADGTLKTAHDATTNNISTTAVTASTGVNAITWGSGVATLAGTANVKGIVYLAPAVAVKAATADELLATYTVTIDGKTLTDCKIGATDDKLVATSVYVAEGADLTVKSNANTAGQMLSMAITGATDSAAKLVGTAGTASAPATYTVKLSASVFDAATAAAATNAITFDRKDAVTSIELGTAPSYSSGVSFALTDLKANGSGADSVATTLSVTKTEGDSEIAFSTNKFTASAASKSAKFMVTVTLNGDSFVPAADTIKTIGGTAWDISATSGKIKVAVDPTGEITVGKAGEVGSTITFFVTVTTDSDFT